jgi:hypothetical protein
MNLHRVIIRLLEAYVKSLNVWDLEVLIRLWSSYEFSTGLYDKNSVAVWTLMIICEGLGGLSVWNSKRGKQLISRRIMWVRRLISGCHWHLCASVIACTLRSQGLRGFQSPHKHQVWEAFKARYIKSRRLSESLKTYHTLLLIYTFHMGEKSFPPK